MKARITANRLLSIQDSSKTRHAYVQDGPYTFLKVLDQPTETKMDKSEEINPFLDKSFY